MQNQYESTKVEISTNPLNAGIMDFYSALKPASVDEAAILGIYKDYMVTHTHTRTQRGGSPSTAMLLIAESCCNLWANPPNGFTHMHVYLTVVYSLELDY